jgi:hypothetical protein
MRVNASRPVCPRCHGEWFELVEPECFWCPQCRAFDYPPKFTLVERRQAIRREIGRIKGEASGRFVLGDLLSQVLLTAPICLVLALFGNRIWGWILGVLIVGAVAILPARALAARERRNAPLLAVLDAELERHERQSTTSLTGGRTASHGTPEFF